MSKEHTRKFEVVSNKHRKYPDVGIQLPKRATKNSAGYDLRTPVAFELEPNSKVTVHTDVKADMYPDEMLICIPRSSVGMKKHCILTNTIGLIDSDYFENEENDGNICLSLKNIGDETVTFEENERICQCVFLKYLTVEDEDIIDAVRKGGIGHTNKNEEKENKEK